MMTIHKILINVFESKILKEDKSLVPIVCFNPQNKIGCLSPSLLGVLSFEEGMGFESRIGLEWYEMEFLILMLCVWFNAGMDLFY